jgi:hypothetical protein
MLFQPLGFAPVLPIALSSIAFVVKNTYVVPEELDAAYHADERKII